MTDTSIIDRLNKKLKRPLKQPERLTWFTKGYKVNSEGNVTHLNIFKSNLMDSIPNEIFELSHLEHLDIRENEIHHLPDDFKALQNLRFIDLRFNNIESLPNGFSKLIQLEKLYLGHNSIRSIPQVIESLIKLNLLDMSENQITDGCDYLIKTPHLKNIYLNNNLIKHFPFDQLINNQLNELALIDNPLSNKPQTINNKVAKLLC